MTEEPEWWEVGGVTVMEESVYDLEGGRINTTWRLLKEGAVEERTSSIRLYTIHELTVLMRETGFEVAGAYGSLEKDPFELGSERLHLVARRRKR